MYGNKQRATVVFIAGDVGVLDFFINQSTTQLFHKKPTVAVLVIIQQTLRPPNRLFSHPAQLALIVDLRKLKIFAFWCLN